MAIYTFFSRRSSHLCMAGRKECFPSQFALFPSFEYYSFCSAHNTVLMYSTAYNLWTFIWFVHLKGTDKIHTEGFY